MVLWYLFYQTVILTGKLHIIKERWGKYGAGIGHTEELQINMET